MVTLSADSGLAVLRDLTNRVWCHKKDSNLRLPPYQDDTLPTELLWHIGWDSWIRTSGIIGPKPIVLPLHYVPLYIN